VTGGSDDADLAAGSSTGQPAHGLTQGLDYLLRHEVSVASESKHGIQNPSEVWVDTQLRREREQQCLPTRTLPSFPKAAAVSGVLVRTLSPAAIGPRSHEPRADCAGWESRRCWKRRSLLHDGRCSVRTDARTGP